MSNGLAIKPTAQVKTVPTLLFDFQGCDDDFLSTGMLQFPSFSAANCYCSNWVICFLEAQDLHNNLRWILFCFSHISKHIYQKMSLHNNVRMQKITAYYCSPTSPKAWWCESVTCVTKGCSDVTEETFSWNGSLTLKRTMLFFFF